MDPSPTPPSHPPPPYSTLIATPIVSRCCLNISESCTYYHRHKPWCSTILTNLAISLLSEILEIFNLFLFSFSAIRATPGTEISPIKHSFSSLSAKNYLVFYFVFHNLSVLSNPTGAWPCHFPLLFLVHVHIAFICSRKAVFLRNFPVKLSELSWPRYRVDIHTHFELIYCTRILGGLRLLLNSTHFAEEWDILLFDVRFNGVCSERLVLGSCDKLFSLFPKITFLHCWSSSTMFYLLHPLFAVGFDREGVYSSNSQSAFCSFCSWLPWDADIYHFPIHPQV